MDEPCAPWTTIEDLRSCPTCAGVEATEDQYERALTIASNWLYRATGRQYRGLCSATIRPIRDCECWGAPRISGWVVIDSRSGVARSVGPGSWPEGREREGAEEVPLGFYPVRAVSQVLIDGDVLAPSSYRIDDYGWLVRTDGDAWPGGQNLTLADTEDGTWSVTLTYGWPIPEDGKLAAEVLAAELVRSMCGQSCRLPQRAQSVASQGISVQLLDPTALVDGDRFGIDEIDRFVRGVNPYGVAEPAVMVNVDEMREFRRTGTTI